jgi:hypothetical protein
MTTVSKQSRARKEKAWIVGFLVVVLGGVPLLFVTMAPERSHPAAVEVEAAVDFSRPVFTKKDAVVCPVDVLATHQSGRDLQAATDAAFTVFGKAAAVAKVGCQLWHDGVALDVPKTSSSSATWVPATDRNGSPLSPILVFGRSLRN